MARNRGFLGSLSPGRILRRIAEAFRAEPEPEPPPRREPPSPPERPPPQGPAPGPAGDRNYRESWRDITDTSPRGNHDHVGSFNRHFELFDSLPGMTEVDDEEKHELWELYLRTMVSGDAIRNDPNNGFWTAMGIHPRSGAFDWDEFRAALGYARRGR